MKARLHRLVPWRAKIAAKMILSRMPITARAWHSLGLFVPGPMRNPEYAIGVFESHWHHGGRPSPGFTYLELGPGESLATAVVAWAFGASGGALVDVGDFAMRNIKAYRPLIELLGLRNTARDVAVLQRVRSTKELLDAVNASYRTDGIRGLSSLPPESVDLVFSQAVLEHVPLSSFDATLRELFRIQKIGGCGSHRIDFRDHLQSSLNSLRFHKNLWEKPWFAARSGFYTNRLRLSEMIAVFEQAGFAVRIAGRDMWPAIPIARTALTDPFRGMAEDDLRTSDADLIVTKR